METIKQSFKNTDDMSDIWISGYFNLNQLEDTFMKRVFTIFILVMLVLSINETYAVGIGIQIPLVGGGKTKATIEDFDEEMTHDYKYAGGIGLVLDTRLAKKGLFNYRLGLGYENTSYDFISDEDASSIYYLDNSFGFGIVQTRVMRIWLGPQLRLAILGFSKEEDGDTFDLAGVGFGIGPVLGANFNFGKVITVALDLGYRYNSYTGTSKYTDVDGYETTTDFDFSQTGYFFNLAVLFRISDVFEREYQEQKPEESLW